MNGIPSQVELARIAIDAAKKAHAPYSNFFVGAALLCDDGALFLGCNVENASYGGTICAERVAACSAIAAGKLNWTRLAVATDGAVYPCGICRQFLMEFGNDLELQIVDASTAESRLIALAELLPHAFSKQNLRHRLS